MAVASDFLIALSDGHGKDTAGKRTPYIKSLGRQIRENEFNEAVTNYLEAELKRCGFRTLQVAPFGTDTSLITRTNLANAKDADAYVSNHYDALDGEFDGEGKDPDGFTAFVYNGQKNKGSGKLAQCIIDEMVKGTPEQDSRGVKEANLHEVRETKMIAVLVENGFMDNEREAMYMIDKAFQKKRAVQQAKGICKYFGVAYVPEKGASTPKPTPAPSKPEPKPEPKPQPVKTDDAGKRVESKVDNLRFYARPSWEDKDVVGEVDKGLGFTIVDLVKVGSGYQYKVKNSKGNIYYLTASETYVTVEDGKAQPAPAKPKTSNGIPIKGYIQIINVSNAAFICDRPSSSKSKNLGTIAKGKKIAISGSVPGWWEVIYKGKRAYVNDKYGKLV